MRRWISAIVAIALFAHAVADAAGVDGHQCADCEAQHLRELLGGDPSRPLTATTDHSNPVDPCHCELHCGGSCNYMPSQKSIVDVLPQAFAAQAILPQGGLASIADALHVWSRGRWREFESPPLRLHLRHQILLI
jgi:hypothetical protein